MKVGESRAIVILTKFDDEKGTSGLQRVEEVAKDLQLHDPVVISARTGYGIRRLKNTIRARLDSKAKPVE